METRFFEQAGGRLAYDLQGDGPLVVCVPGMGDLRSEYRFLAPALAAAGLRVATLDVRGHGESSVGFADYAASAIGADVLALARALSAPSVSIVGTSMAAAAAVWAAAEAPELVRSVVLVGPFVHDAKLAGFQRAMLRLALLRPWGPAAWSAYYKTLYPSTPPTDLAQHRDAVKRNLRQKGRLEALRAMMWASKADCEARLPSVRAPALVVMGASDPDFPDPAAEAGRIAEELHAELLLVDGAGHYPHVEKVDVAAPAVAAFLRAHA
jgi:pimeloyl-ACP methyl ester carboxylesterase